jgi:hypothetical protein
MSGSGPLPPPPPDPPIEIEPPAPGPVMSPVVMDPVDPVAPPLPVRVRVSWVDEHATTHEKATAPATTIRRKVWRGWNAVVFDARIRGATSLMLGRARPLRSIRYCGGSMHIGTMVVAVLFS